MWGHSRILASDFADAVILINKMTMMLIFSIIVMCSYPSSVWLVWLVLKNTSFKEHLSVVASKYSTWDIENKTGI